MEAKEAEEGETRHPTQPGGGVSGCVCVGGQCSRGSFQKKTISAEGEKGLDM